jgi:hypothetical protein
LARKNPRESSQETAAGIPPAGTALENDEFLDGLKREGNARRIGPVRLQSRISKGGMGIVYRGRHVKLDIDVAVKFLLPNLATQNPEYVVRFDREAKIAAQLNNENLVRVFDVDSEKDYHYVVMELVCGETARDRVARKGPLSEHEAVEIILGATRGLEAAHRKGIVHRDIKPENIMIDATGVVKLADLGIAKLVDGGDGPTPPESITQPGFVMGTPSFMPPEQFHDSSSVGFAGDIYSMGATLYFLLTGKPPYAGNIYEVVRTISTQDFPDVSKERPEVSSRVTDILHRCTRREPRARYSDASDLLRALETSGTDRRKLDEADMGTVTAVARVSTPPARRVGEIRLELPDEGRIFDEVHGRHPGEKSGRNRRGLIALAGIAAFACIFAAGLSVARKKGDELRPRVAPASNGASPAPNSKGTEAPSPPATASQEPDHRPETKADPVTVTEPVEKVTVEPAVEKTPAEKLKEANERLEERRRYNAALLSRARDLVRSGDTISARNIFESVKDWGELSAQATRVRLEALLASNPPREIEARDLLRTVCSDAGAAEPGGACDLAYQATYAYAQDVPAVGSGATTWERKFDFWKNVSPPPAALEAASKARATAREKLLSGFLAFLAEGARKALLSEDVAGARRLLDRAAKLMKDERIEAEFPRESALLDAQKKAAGDLETELGAWQGLATFYPSTSPLAKLEVSELRSRVEKFAEFARKYPSSPRKITAENYRRRYQEEIDRRGKP